MSVESEIPSPPNSPVEVFYGPCKLVPAPLVDMTVEPQFDDSGNRTQNVTRITLDGTVLILPSGSYEQMYVKQDELKAAFATDNLDFTIRAGPGNKTLAEGVMICSGLQPKVSSLQIEPDIHVTRFDYNIELEDIATVAGVSGVTSSLSDQWSFRENPDSCIVEVTHNVSATGPDGVSDRFDQALREVKSRLGIDKLPLTLPCFVEPNASGLFNITHPSVAGGGPIFEVSVQREETADVAGGSYSASEVFTIVSGVPFFFDQRSDQFQEDVNGIATVTIAGTVQGLGRTIGDGFGETGGLGFNRACSGWVNQVRPQLPADASGVYLKYKQTVGSGLFVNNPTSLQITQNKCRGTIAFSITYTDDPSADLPSGIVSRTCSIQRNNGIRQNAVHAIPFRRLGPIVQDIKTTTEGSVSINCQVQAKNTGDPDSDNTRALQFAQGEMNRLRKIHANSVNFVTLYVTAGPNKTIDDRALTLTANITYGFTVDLASVQAADSDIIL